MAIITPYTPVNFKDAPDYQTTPLSAANLNHMETGISNNVQSLTDLNTEVSNLTTDVSNRDDDARASIDNTYSGVNLATKFATEIANYTSAWAWIQNRLDNNNLEGIHVGDYIKAVVGNETHDMQIAGIDTYYRTADSNIGHHIDWISRDCYSTTVKWNTTNYNNGNSSVQSPFKASNVYDWLNNTLYPLLPAELRAVIKNKRLLAPYRYSSGGTITDDNSWGWEDFGPLWLPLEHEIFDGIVWSTKGYGNGQSVTYPIFRGSYKNRIKGAGPGGARTPWWTASANSGGSTIVVAVGYDGGSNYSYASNAFCVPVCFRMIKA